MGFIFTVLGIYAAVNAYLLGKMWVAMPMLGRWRFALVGFVLAMIAGPVIVRYLEKWEDFRAAEYYGDVVYVWAAMMLWFFFLMLVADAWNLLAWLAHFAWPAARSAIAPAWLQLSIVGSILVAAAVAGFYGAQDIGLEEVRVRVPSLPDGRQELRIVQLTDLHLGEHVRQHRLDKIVAMVREAQPDLIVGTGDLLDAPLDQAVPLAGPLAALQPPLGKYAIFGNHEFYSNAQFRARNGAADKFPSDRFYEMCGFTVLRQRSVMIGRELVLVGVDDPAGLRFDGPALSDEEKVLPSRERMAAPDRPTVLLLKHQPRIRPDLLGRFDLQVSGHTHGGQIFPFHLFTRMYYQHYRGLADLGQKSKLYVSRGAGTWGPPIRLFARPEVTVIVLTTKG